MALAARSPISARVARWASMFGEYIYRVANLLFLFCTLQQLPSCGRQTNTPGLAGKHTHTHTPCLADKPTLLAWLGWQTHTPCLPQLVVWLAGWLGLPLRPSTQNRTFGCQNLGCHLDLVHSSDDGLGCGSGLSQVGSNCTSGSNSQQRALW